MAALLGFAVGHLRGDWRRAAAAAAAIFVAVTSFVVLTGTVSTQRLQVTKEVASNYRSTYDILVRPHGSQTTIEESDGLVRPNFLTGQYGGITLAQVKKIAAVPGVQVAAPVAVLGQTMRSVLIPVDVSSVLGDRDDAMVRFSVTGTARHGTATTANQHGYLYLTRQPLTLDQLKDTSASDIPASPAEFENRNGQKITGCLASDAAGNPTNPATTFQEDCSSLSPDPGGGEVPHPRVEVSLSMPLTVEAVDPDAEAELTGLDGAIVNGRPLRESDSAGTDTDGPAPIQAATAVMATRLPFDFQSTVRVEELSAATTDQVLASNDATIRADLVNAATPVRTVAEVAKDAAATYRSDIVADVDVHTASADQSLFVLGLEQPGQISYRTSSRGVLSPTVVPFDPAAWRADDHSGQLLPTPSSVADTGYRPITLRSSQGRGFVSFRIVGTYDADRLPRPSKLNEVPLETYRPSSVEGANTASRTALGGKPMLSDLDPAGYVQSPPALLVPLKALPMFEKNFTGLNTTAPISSVRVKVAGITGMDPVSREKVRQIAQRIHTTTGLDVDITIGSSLQNRKIALPATRSGTPALLVDERWTKKGVAVAISQALDAKSLFLFIVVLASCAFTVALIATASVQARRREIAVLACLGWPAARRRTLVGAELALLGLAAGSVGALVAWPLARVLDIHTSWWQITAAIPLGMLLALLPGLAATTSAGRITPIEAFRPREGRRRRHGRTLQLRGPGSLGLIMVAQRPARVVLASAAVALAVASTVLLAAIVAAFHGTVVGSFLGDAVDLQVRTPDVVADIVLVVLGLTAVATVLLLAAREDAPAYAALQATGWTDGALTLTLLTQAAVIGLIGSLAGAALALAVAATLVGHLTQTTLAIAAGLVVAAVLASAAAALIPSAVIARLPTARILAAE